jgi:hypothetical protein
MLFTDGAFLEIMKTIILTFSLFPKSQHNCSLQESHIFLLLSKINTIVRKCFHKVNGV